MVDIYEALKNLNSVEENRVDDSPLIIDESLIHGMEQAHSNGIFEDFVLDSLQYEYHTVDELCEAFEYTEDIPSELFNEAIATYLCHKNKSLTESLDETKLVSLAELYKRVSSQLGDVKKKELENSIKIISKKFYGLFSGSVKAAEKEGGFMKAIFGGKAKNMVAYYNTDNKSLGKSVEARLALEKVNGNENVRIREKLGIAVLTLTGLGTIILFKDLKTFQDLNKDELKEINDNSETPAAPVSAEGEGSPSVPVEERPSEEENGTSVVNAEDNNSVTTTPSNKPQIEITKKLLQKFHRIAYGLGLKIFDASNKPYNIAKFQDAQKITLKNIGQFTIETKGKKYPLDKWLKSMAKNKIITESLIDQDAIDTMGLDEDTTIIYDPKDGKCVFELFGQEYSGICRGESITMPGMYEVMIDSKYYDDIDIIDARTPIYNPWEDRYVKDGKFLIPMKEVQFQSLDEMLEEEFTTNDSITMDEYMSGFIDNGVDVDKEIKLFTKYAKILGVDDYNQLHILIDNGEYDPQWVFPKKALEIPTNDADRQLIYFEDAGMLAEYFNDNIFMYFKSPEAVANYKTIAERFLNEMDFNESYAEDIDELAYKNSNDYRENPDDYKADDLFVQADKYEEEKVLIGEALEKDETIVIGGEEKEIKTSLDFQVVDFIDHEIKTYADITKSESEYFLEKDELIDCIIGDLEAASYSFNEK